MGAPKRTARSGAPKICTCGSVDFNSSFHYAIMVCSVLHGNCMGARYCRVQVTEKKQWFSDKRCEQGGREREKEKGPERER